MKSFKVFGERHTGTNAISSFIEKSFNLENKYYEYLGWKHRLAPSNEELKKHNLVDNLFLITFRNPYSWLRAMHREPYNYNYPQIRELDFLSFIQIPFEDYENVIKMWNQKNHSYLNMKPYLPNSIYIKIESFNNNQELFFDEVIKKIGADDNYNFIEENRYLSGYSISNKNIRQSLRVPYYKNEELEVIDSFIDNNILKEIGYSKPKKS